MYLAQLALFGLLSSTAVIAQDGLVIPADGLEYKFAPDGGLAGVYSTYAQPVLFPDRRGIKTAQVIAEEKAKAAIIRFMEQKVKSGVMVKEVESGIETATRTQGSGADKFVKQNERKMIQTVTEFNGSFASGKLTGVSVLEQGYNEKTEEAWVKVGYNLTTIGLANSAKSLMNSSGKASPPGTEAQVGSSPSDPVTRQPSDVRRRELPR
jgi:hypothetical protein